MMFEIVVLGLIVLIVAGVLTWAFMDTNPKPAKPDKLWSPGKLAMVEHETGVHPLRRQCAEDGCTQCRMFVDAPRPVPLGDGRYFYPSNDPGPIEMSDYNPFSNPARAMDAVALPNWQRSIHGLPVMPHGGP